MIQMASSNTIIQTVVDDDKRGRVMSLYTMAFMGSAPFGSFIAGSLAKIIGTPVTILLGGMMCIGGAVVFASKLHEIQKMIKPIYYRKGIISDEDASL